MKRRFTWAAWLLTMAMGFGSAFVLQHGFKGDPMQVRMNVLYTQLTMLNNN